MYKVNPVWNEFYAELDPGKREKILKELLASAEDDGANDFRQKIFKKRYTDPKNPKHRIDLFLQQCIYLPTIYKKRKFFMVNVKKEIRITMEATCLDRIDSYSESEKGALYAELKNAAARYFKTCSGSKYGSTLFGISKAKDEDKERLAAKDAWEMYAGMPKFAGVEREMEMFSHAVRDAFCERYTNGEELLSYAEEKYGKTK